MIGFGDVGAEKVLGLRIARTMGLRFIGLRALRLWVREVLLCQRSQKFLRQNAGRVPRLEGLRA